MTRERHDLIRFRHEQTQRRTGRSDTNGAAPAAQRFDPSQHVTGALSEGRPGNDVPFGHVSALSAKIIGESHGIGLNVLWAVLSDRNRLLPTG
jgi:hypothetical protein